MISSLPREHEIDHLDGNDDDEENRQESDCVRHRTSTATVSDRREKDDDIGGRTKVFHGENERQDYPGYAEKLIHDTCAKSGKRK